MSLARPGDTLNTAPAFATITLPDVNVGTGTFTLPTAALTSRLGQRYRIVDPAGQLPHHPGTADHHRQ